MVKTALMECEKAGCQVKFLRGDDLDIKPCTGCISCVVGMTTGRGKGGCPVKDDFHILDEALMECDAVIVGSPTYVLSPTGKFKVVCDRIGPSHFVWQMIDYIQPLYEFKDKIFHVHYKDIKVYPDRLQQVGIMGYPLDFMSPKLPGLGDVNWGKYVSALTDIGYQGYTCIEIEDKAFEGSVEDVKKSVLLSTKYLRNYVI